VCWCGEEAVERTVKEEGKNKGRLFYVCRRPAGKKGTPGARCDFFRWQDDERRRVGRE
jgi:hypothetical protein